MKQKMYLAAAALAFLGLGYFIGFQTQKGAINGQLFTYEEIIKEIQSAEASLGNLDREVQFAEASLEELAEEKKKTQDLIGQKSALESVIKDLQAEREIHQKATDDLAAKQKAEQQKLDSLKGAVVKAAGKPKTLSAGTYNVGTHLPAGRYKATSNRMGNFVVYGSSGYADVNTILDPEADIGEKEYIFNTSNGDRLELSTTTIFTPLTE